MKQYMTYPVRAVEFDGDEGSGMEHLGDLLREVADWLDDMLTTRRPGDTTSYDLSITLDEGLYKAMLYVYGEEVPA